MYWCANMKGISHKQGQHNEVLSIEEINQFN